jgi:putative endonuclease
MARHNITGEIGEQAAAAYLETKGFSIICRNWKYLKAELDIIARKDDILVIAEVKTRGTDAFGDPEAWVDIKKQRNIIKAANAYVLEHNLDIPVRFDVLSVLVKDGEMEINHIEDAFYPMA